jgi:peptidoglycan/xylan/chitin deacetylase (PgdA/CDA1 family)
LLNLKPLFQGEHWTTEWFRFVRAYAFWFGVRQAVPDELWQQWLSRTPILMYHAFGMPGEKPRRYVVSAQRFDQQMAWLKRNGYHVLSLAEFAALQRERRLPPARSAVITIDDAYTDVKRAYSILQRYGFPATLFVVSGRVGDANRWDQDGELSGRPLLDWLDLKALAQNCIEIGAHTRTHPHLRSMTAEEAQAEIEGSRVDLERELDVPIRTFAYPYGEYDAVTEAAVRDAGFQGCCGVTPDPAIAATSPYALPRIEIRGTDSLLDFVLKLHWGRGVRAANRIETA